MSTYSPARILRISFGGTDPNPGRFGSSPGSPTVSVWVEVPAAPPSVAVKGTVVPVAAVV